MNTLDSFSATNYCSQFVDLTVDNPKGNTFDERFVEIISDPNNVFIKRCDDAGKIDGEYVIMHNGLKVLKDGYCGEFSKILTINQGCHEPAEERMFELILRDIPDNGVMLELGSYWAFYSMWFHKQVKNAQIYCIEPELENLTVGKQNCQANGIHNIDFTQAFIGKNHLSVSDFVKSKNIDQIDILHSDIQSFELEMLQGITDLLSQRKIRYLFVSTHTNNIHYKCIELLKQYNYRIIASADFDTETFCCDGIIVACLNSNTKFGHYNLGNRRRTKLKTLPPTV